MTVVDLPHQLRDHEIGIGIALAMCVGAQVDRHAVECDVDIGAVVETEATKEILVRLALAAVLCDGQPWYCLERFALPVGRKLLQLPRPDDPLRGRIGRASDRRCSNDRLRQG
jgi:hypothetical protein